MTERQRMYVMGRTAVSEAVAGGATQAEVGRIHGVGQPAISEIVRGLMWQGE